MYTSSITRVKEQVTKMAEKNFSLTMDMLNTPDQGSKEHPASKPNLVRYLLFVPLGKVHALRSTSLPCFHYR